MGFVEMEVLLGEMLCGYVAVRVGWCPQSDSARGVFPPVLAENGACQCICSYRKAAFP
jgi:hypothetical protein